MVTPQAYLPETILTTVTCQGRKLRPKKHSETSSSRWMPLLLQEQVLLPQAIQDPPVPCSCPSALFQASSQPPQKLLGLPQVSSFCPCLSGIGF